MNNIKNNKFTKQYSEYINEITVNEDLHKRLVDIPNTIAVKKTNHNHLMKQFTHIAATVCILVMSLGAIGIFMSLPGISTDSDKGEVAKKPTSTVAESNSDFTNNVDAQIKDDASTPREDAVPESASIITTYDYFCSTYENTPHISEDTKTYGSNLLSKEDDLLALLPQALQSKLAKDSIQLTQTDNVTTLTCLYSPVNTTTGKLSITVHPMYEYEHSLIVSTSDVSEYSLSLFDQNIEIDHIRQFSKVMLYPIFYADELTKDVIASRQYTSGNTTTFSFGVYKDDYVITYEATGLTAEELNALLLK